MPTREENLLTLLSRELDLTRERNKLITVRDAAVEEAHVIFAQARLDGQVAYNNDVAAIDIELAEIEETREGLHDDNVDAR